MNALLILLIVVIVVAVIAIIAFVIYRSLNPRLKKDEEQKSEQENAEDELKRILTPIDDEDVKESMRKYDEQLQREEQQEITKDQNKEDQGN